VSGDAVLVGVIVVDRAMGGDSSRLGGLGWIVLDALAPSSSKSPNTEFGLPPGGGEMNGKAEEVLLAFGGGSS
jgi:hypothetical protein